MPTRVSEVVSLRFGDVDEDRRQIRVVQGKGRRDRMVTLPTSLEPILRRLRRMAKPDDWLFPSSEDPRRHLSPRTAQRAMARAVGAIIERVVVTQRKKRDPLDGVSRIGIDEVSYRRGHRYLTVVVDHDSGRLLFTHEGKGAPALEAFFDALGDRAANITVASLDGSVQYNEVCRRRCPQASLCMDPFHVVKWATDAVDEVRRRAWNAVRATGDGKAADVVKGTRYAVLKNPENLNDKQRLALSLVEKHNKPLFRAYLLKEQLREVFKQRDVVMLAWAQRSRIPEFVAVGRSIKRAYAAIAAAFEHGLSNARVEALNTRMQLLTRVAFGFHSAKALAAMAMLKLGGFCPSLPGRTTHEFVS